MIDPNNPDYSNTPASPQRTYQDYRPLDAKAAPKVSILTPFYNTGEVFHETARSIFRQTFQQWEWLIINDCSTDPHALGILQQYRDLQDPRIRVIDNPQNLGLPGSRNAGIQQAKAEYIYLLDDDDLIEPTTIEKTFWYLFTNPECGFVNGWSVGFGAEEYLWPHGFNERDRFLKANAVTGRAMVRKSVFEKTGGYDASARGGMEDWLFWLNAAESGYWGHTIPEYQDWYRRREQHWTRWETIANEEKLETFRKSLRERFPKTFAQGIPEYREKWHYSFDEFEDKLPAENRLKNTAKRLLLIIPWMDMGGADKYNLDVVQQLTSLGWEITIITTKQHHNPWSPRFSQFTHQIFPLYNFVHPVYHPLAIRYFIESRNPDAVLMSCSELAYWILPYLRHHCPKTPLLDYSHIEEDYWKNGGHPRYAARSQGLLDLNLVTSTHLKQWMVDRYPVDPDKIIPITINVDENFWKPDPEVNVSMREKLGISKDQAVIFFAGRICPQKQPEVLAGVIKQLAKESVDFTFLIAGDGENKSWLEGFIQQNSLNNCTRLLGSCNSEQILEFMQTADIFFLPSLWEGIALSIYEAMATGTVVVGAKVGGQAELVTTESGVLMDTQSMPISKQIIEYSKIIKTLINNPKNRIEIGIAARKRITENFTLDKMTQNLIGAFDIAQQNAQHGRSLTIPKEFSHELAIRAVEYFRSEKVAEHLWSISQNQKKQTESIEKFYPSDPLKDWNHIHKFLPFKFYRLQKKIIRKFYITNAKLDSYNDDLTTEERLTLLTKSIYYQRIMSLKRYRLLSKFLPRHPIQ